MTNVNLHHVLSLIARLYGETTAIVIESLARQSVKTGSVSPKQAAMAADAMGLDTTMAPKDRRRAIYDAMPISEIENAISELGRDDNASEIIAEQVKLARRVKNGYIAVIRYNSEDAYMAAAIFVLATQSRGYNRGELAELASAIAFGVFPTYGIANNRSAKDDTADLVIGDVQVSCKHILAQCTFAANDNADILLATTGNSERAYILSRSAWMDLERKHAIPEASRNSRRTPKKRELVDDMMAWIEGQLA